MGIPLALTATADDSSFTRTVRPILSEHCFPCHGPERQEAELRLDLNDFSAVNSVIGASSDLIRRILLARRLIERGVRCVQLFHRGWDHHDKLPRSIRGSCQKTDQPSAALIRDLKQRGLLDDTLVLWCGEFGRTSYSQGRLTKDSYGRDHHPRCFSLWMAGGGVQPGTT